ncbi:MAG TPA: lipocalin family protein [Flavisolibacter sp.]|nr:lipocalin family protein [Flavisolibacter sp.]
MKKTLLAFTTLSILLFASCNKEGSDENEEPSLTKESLAGNYKLTSAKASVPGVGERDAMDIISPEPCQKDDIIALKADLTYEYKDEGTECTPSGDETGTWTLNGDQLAAGPYEFTVTKWDGRVLQGTTKESIEIIPGIPTEITITFEFTRQ